jgi:hypothetical protein
MEDRPDLIQSELAGLAADSTQQVFRSADIQHMFTQEPVAAVFDEPIYLVIDPAAGGPQSDYAFVTMTRWKGCLQVSIVGLKLIL